MVLHKKTSLFVLGQLKIVGLQIKNFNSVNGQVYFIDNNAESA